MTIHIFEWFDQNKQIEDLELVNQLFNYRVTIVQFLSIEKFYL